MSNNELSNPSNKSTPSPQSLNAISIIDSESNDSTDKVLDSKGSAEAMMEDDGSSQGFAHYPVTGGLTRSESMKSASSLTEQSSTDDVARYELRKLSLDQNGTFMSDFDPEKSQREMRKMNRRIYTRESKRNVLYDEKGVLLDMPLDLCDCLDTQCEGCHFSCPRCGSNKCGVDCRCNRKYTVDVIEVEGTETIFMFPT